MLKHDHLARPDFLSLDENILYDGFSLKNYRLVNEAFLFDEFHFVVPEVDDSHADSIEKSIEFVEVEKSAAKSVGDEVHELKS
jgi:hypothetical protein